MPEALRSCDRCYDALPADWPDRLCIECRAWERHAGDRQTRRCLDAVLADVVAWGRQTFPASTDRTTMRHLLREVGELAADPSSAEEMADVLMLLAHLAAAHAVDLAAAVEAKLARCRTRRWGPPDADGVVEHVRE